MEAKGVSLEDEEPLRIIDSHEVFDNYEELLNDEASKKKMVKYSDA